MNGYLQRKCRSEQQLMNELSKLLLAKDYASKKMGELLKELAFFYVNPAQQRLPHSVLKDLLALLGNLKDKKEDLRLARLVLCFLSTLILQFERVQLASGAAAVRTATRTQSAELTTALMSSLLKAMETSELNHTSLPRQCTILKMYAHLCRIFHKTDALLLRTRPLLQKSPVWGVLSGDRKIMTTVMSKKEFPAQLAAIGAAMHGIRFHLDVDEQLSLLETLFQAAFLPNCIASRHAAATLLSLFETSTQCATSVVKALEWYLMKFRPTSLRVGDVLATTYLLRLCGQISRLPVNDETASPSSVRDTSSNQRVASNAAASNLLDFSFDMPISVPVSIDNAPPPSPLPSPIARQRKRLEGVSAPSALVLRIKDWLLDILVSPDASGPLQKTTPIVLVAMEETVKEIDADACVMKARGNTGTVFEIVASILMRLLGEGEKNVVLLHRLCRVVQLIAECLDGAVLQLTGPAHQPQFLDAVTDKIGAFAAHSNAFIACESLRALVWLLPRQLETPVSCAGWEMLMTRLMELPVDHIHPEARRTIAEAFFHRAVTNPSLHQHEVDAAMLSKGMRITLTWLQASPCEWHAEMLVKMWHTALRKCIDPMGGEVFQSINDVLECHHQTNRATTELVQQATLQFLGQTGVKYVLHNAHWFQSLTLRLTKHMLLESLGTRRLSVHVFTQLHIQAQQQGKHEMAQHISSLFQYLQLPPPHEEQQHSEFLSKVHSMSVKDALGIQDMLLSGLETRPSSAAPAFQQPVKQPRTASAFDGMF